MLSLLRLEHEQKNSSNSFQICIFLFLSYSLGIETINTFIHSHSSLENHTRFQTKMSKVYTVFRPKRRKNPTRWGGPYIYSLYGGVPPWAISTRQNIIQYIVQLVFLIYTYPLNPMNSVICLLNNKGVLCSK